MNSIFLCALAVLAVTTTVDATLKCKAKFKCFDDKLDTLVNEHIAVELQGHYTYLYLSQIFDQHKSHYPQVTKYLRAKSSEELSHAERFMEYQNQRGGTVSLSTVERYDDGNCATVSTITQALRCAMELEAHVTTKLTELHNNVQNIEHSECTGDIDDDDLRLTQPVLVNCKKIVNGPVKTVGGFSVCVCSTIEKVAYVELAEMIAHEFLGHQVEDTKEIANLYYNIKKMQPPVVAGETAADTKKRESAAALADFLFDKNM